MTPDLDQTLADARGQAQVIRAHGHTTQADSIERVCEAVAECMREYLTWLSEPEAELYTGLKTAALRARFPSLEKRGLAKWDEPHPRRLYRRQGLEHRGNSEAARAAGVRAAEGSAA